MGCCRLQEFFLSCQQAATPAIATCVKGFQRLLETGNIFRRERTSAVVELSKWRQDRCLPADTSK